MTIRIALFLSMTCATLILTQPVKAERRWVYQYLDACEPSSPDWPVCEAYIEGFLGAIKALSQNGKISTSLCLPENISAKQLAKALREFAEQHPYNTLAMEGALNIVLSMKFPCRAS
ncbi:Rap1a/Tai family immunity protein [Microvirga flocculans]|uniref:Rap1a/Tai family immunity protein n=1 Tax=Microvirga flocculans TaxID=217168 RepID=UPI0034A10121